MNNLYQLSSGFNNIMDLVLDESMDLDVLEGALKEIEADLETKVADGIGLIKQLESYSQGMDAEAERLKKQASFINNRIKAIKQWYQVNLEAIGKDKIQTNRGAMKVCKNSMPTMVIDNENEIMPEFMTIIPEHMEINTKALREAYKQGRETKGVHFVQGKHIRIS